MNRTSRSNILPSSWHVPRHESRSAPVKVQRLTGQAPSRTVGLVWRRSNPLADRYAGLAEALRASLA